MDKKESNFWNLLKAHLPKTIDTQRIETGSTGRGIPDVNMCKLGKEIWVELKVVKGRKVQLSPEQTAWHFRRTRAGGTTWILARDKVDGVRKGKYDKIYAWSGKYSVDVSGNGIDSENAIVWERPFDWDEIWQLLFS
tara:strand:+ start:20478 stop:20888 length:411 start_codon:yes stop_codon:yes gene_type:complete